MEHSKWDFTGYQCVLKVFYSSTNEKLDKSNYIEGVCAFRSIDHDQLFIPLL